jgi:dTDP-4-dehydrorhamnose reductase
MRVLIVGANGQVGVELQRSFANAGEVLCYGRDKVNLAEPSEVRALVRDTKPAVILNAAAYTAVDRAESEPEVAMAVNALAPRTLAEEALRANAILVHYSTDYVFDGSKTSPWVETDKPNPLNQYGATKLAGEEAIREVGGRYLIFRTSWVYGPHGNNFLLTMLRLGRERESLNIVDDQIGAPTTSIQLADTTRAVIDGVWANKFGVPESWAGLYHTTSSGSVSWCGFAQAIFARANSLLDRKSPVVHPIPTSKYPAPAKRPRNSVLSNEKLASVLGIRLDSWESALDEVLQKLTATK